MANYKFEGWVGLDPKSVEGNMVWQDFEPKPWEETDIDIQVTHSGICAPYPLCVGHEIVGIAVRVGSQAEGGIKKGDCVGGDCDECAAGLESYCSKMVITYGSTHFNGGRAMGGHATHHRYPPHFVVKIPDGLASEHAALMLCGGLTLYAPLRYHGCGRDMKVGIVGIGGLRHFGVLFAKALGADRVMGVSRSASKREEVLQMGAEKNDKSLNLIISTLSYSKVSLQDYLSLLKTDGTFVQVGNPDDGGYAINPITLITRRIKFTGPSTGSPREMAEMLQLAADKKVYPWVEQRPMSEVNQAIMDMEAGKVRYRYVLTN
ncbi:zinc-binding dehydrogenase [Dactylonectria macrodidyma]|uniref:Zinc-binding dehydrogenase n=1 Tax=Dactylonectria macrodidyma TaxID=307937 RepID=A0A9P9FH87_9HYPO|nr:zinc-binding dehydrogenase [Dactylonectria macrodidyma]